MVGQGFAGGIHLGAGGVAADHGVGTRFIDDARGGELLVLGVLDVAETEQNLLFLARGQGDVDVQRAHRGPPVGDGAGAVPGADGLGVCRAAVHPAECVAGGVEAGDWRVGPEHRVVVAAFAVLGLVVDDAGLHLHFAGGEVALEVGAVVDGVPQAELHIAEDVQLLHGVGVVLQGQAVQLAGVAFGYEQLLRGGHAVLLALDHGVAQAVAAGVAVQRGLGGLPAGVPDGIAVLDVDVVAVHVQRGAVVAVAGQAAHPGVAVEAVAARRVGDKAEEILAAQVVDPGQGRARGGDDVFLAFIIEVTESHKCFLLVQLPGRPGCFAFAKTIKHDGGSILFAFRIAEPRTKCKSFCEKTLERFFHKTGVDARFLRKLFPAGPSGQSGAQQNEGAGSPFKSNIRWDENDSEKSFDFNRNVTKTIRDAQFWPAGTEQNAKSDAKSPKLLRLRLIFRTECAIMNLRKRLRT